MGSKWCAYIYRTTDVEFQNSQLELIFELGKSFWPHRKGSGYGLWRAKNIVERIGGEVKVESVVGKGKKVLRNPASCMKLSSLCD